MAQDATPITPKPERSAAARLCVLWLRIAFAAFVIALVGAAWSFWLPYPWSGNVGSAAAFISIAAIPSFIFASILWARVPKSEESWCAGLGFFEADDEEPEEQRRRWAA